VSHENAAVTRGKREHVCVFQAVRPAAVAVLKSISEKRLTMAVTMI
jgi:hypothetical protein